MSSNEQYSISAWLISKMYEVSILLTFRISSNRLQQCTSDIFENSAFKVLKGFDKHNSTSKKQIKDILKAKRRMQRKKEELDLL
jgi:hypothetical protein